MKKYPFLLACLAMLGSAGEGFAQTEVDVLRYSRTQFGGTARTVGLAGANVALGGDAGSLSANPAGLGLYRRSEFTVSAGVNYNETNSNVYGSTAMDDRNNLNIPQFAGVFATRKADGEEGDWRGGSFGIGFTRLNNFNQNIFYQGESLAEDLKFGEYAAQLADRDPFINGELQPNTIQDLAYQTYLIDRRTDGFYEAPLLFNENFFSESIQTTGSQNQWEFSYGASFRDKLFLGASIGLNTINFKQIRTYTEDDPAEDITSLSLRDELKTEGTGIFLKVGAIYRASDAVRFGLTVQTPTYYSMNDQYSTSLSVNYTEAPEAGASLSQYFVTDPGLYEYSLTTPFKASGGVALFAGKNGFLTADVEYINYSQGKLDADDYSFNEEDQATRSLYGSAVNYRVGAEARLNIFRIRGGYAHYGDAFKNSDYDRATNYITGGVGIRQDNYFIDAAVMYGKNNSLYSPYSNLDFNDTSSPYVGLNTPVVETEHKNTNVTVTVGWNF